MIKYKQQITVFIDVLGFSNIVFNDDNTKLDLYFQFLQTTLKKIADYKSIQHYYISDSIILTTTANLENFIRICKVVQEVQSRLLSINILVRGGISIGDLYIETEKNIIVGPSLINSFNLEELAKFPRIIIDRGVLKYFNINSSSDFLSTLNTNISGSSSSKLINKDDDSFFYINYLSHFLSRKDAYQGKMFMEHLYDFFKNNFYKNQHLDKYNWLKENCIKEIERQLAINKQVTPYGSKRSIATNKNKINLMPNWITKLQEL